MRLHVEANENRARSYPNTVSRSDDPTTIVDAFTKLSDLKTLLLLIGDDCVGLRVACQG